MRYRALALFLTTTLLCGGSFADSVSQTSITIIIDDIGNNLPLGLRAVALPGPITYAVLPHSPHGRSLANTANRNNKEVMLHMPMDNNHGLSLGPGGLTEQLDHERFRRNLESAINSVPYIRGVNNHMGSRLTRNRSKMDWLMASLKKYPLYFLDSRTSADTVASLTATHHRIPTLSRDVFLDNDPSPAAIHREFKRLIKLARQQGSAVAIGHPYPSTLGYLENVIPKLGRLGIRLVSPSSLLQIRSDDGFNQDAEITTAAIGGKSKGRCNLRETIEVTRVNCS